MYKCVCKYKYEVYICAKRQLKNCLFVFFVLGLLTNTQFFNQCSVLLNIVILEIIE